MQEWASWTQSSLSENRCSQEENRYGTSNYQSCSSGQVLNWAPPLTAVINCSPCLKCADPQFGKPELGSSPHILGPHEALPLWVTDAAGPGGGREKGHFLFTFCPCQHQLSVVCSSWKQQLVLDSRCLFVSNTPSIGESSPKVLSLCVWMNDLEGKFISQVYRMGVEQSTVAVATTEDKPSKNCLV